MKRQSGFTLIELVVVIVILGILAAVAVPRFVNLQNDARAASINGVLGAVNSASALVHARWLVNSTSPVTVEGGTVTVNAQGYPTSDALGIIAALSGFSGYAVAHTATTSTFTVTGYAGANCQVVYTAASGTAVATTSGC